jgi:hypothetical protein
VGLLFFFAIAFLEGSHLLLQTEILGLQLPKGLWRDCLYISRLCDLLPQFCQVPSILLLSCPFARAASFRPQFLLELSDPPLQLQDVTVAFLQQLIESLARLCHPLRVTLFLGLSIIAANVVVPPA